MFKMEDVQHDGLATEVSHRVTQNGSDAGVLSWRISIASFYCKRFVQMTPPFIACFD